MATVNKSVVGTQDQFAAILTQLQSHNDSFVTFNQGERADILVIAVDDEAAAAAQAGNETLRAIPESEPTLAEQSLSLAISLAVSTCDQYGAILIDA